MEEQIRTRIHWDIGTAYDLFISLRILHEPEEYNIRASWAAGVRSRVPLEHRQTLEQLTRITAVPLAFIHSLDEPKDSRALLNKIRQISPIKFLEEITIHPRTPQEIKDLFHNTSPRKKWSKEEIELLSNRRGLKDSKTAKVVLKAFYDAWAQPEFFHERVIGAIEAYVETFFAEEEQRIRPILEEELSHARMRAGSRPLPAMLEEITSGVRLGDLGHISSITLAPTFWGSPFMFFEHLRDYELIALFGARPGTMSIIPGDIVPDALLRGMKAMADSTRLRILRYLAQEPQTAAELSRILRLRPPTVNHHLNQLRLAGMVQVFLSSSGEKKFAARYEGFDNTQDLLNRFVRGE
ncbi:MAG: ArsR/SmtB family transcription factor [Anaerolineaceae bacterium]|jgi:DNA-binding transcriptional ArsR family regulator